MSIWLYNETGIYSDARVQHLRQIQQPQANNPFVNKYSKDQCGKMRHNRFRTKKRNEKQSPWKGFPGLCISSRTPVLFPRNTVIPHRDWNGPKGNVWRTRKVAAELIPAILQGSKLLCRSEIDGPLWLGEW